MMGGLKYKPDDIPEGTGILEITACEIAWHNYPAGTNDKTIRKKLARAITNALKELNFTFVPGALLIGEQETVERSKPCK